MRNNRIHGVVDMQVLMFSATLHSQEVKDVASKICQQPIVVDLKVRKCTSSEQLLLRTHAVRSSHHLVRRRPLYSLGNTFPGVVSSFMLGACCC